MKGRVGDGRVAHLARRALPLKEVVHGVLVHLLADEGRMRSELLRNRAAEGLICYGLICYGRRHRTPQGLRLNIFLVRINFDHLNLGGLPLHRLRARRGCPACPWRTRQRELVLPADGSLAAAARVAPAPRAARSAPANRALPVDCTFDRRLRGEALELADSSGLERVEELLGGYRALICPVGPVVRVGVRLELIG